MSDSWVITMEDLVCHIVFWSVTLAHLVSADTFGQSRLVYEWAAVDYLWPSPGERLEALRNGTFVPERNLIAGIKVYKNAVYLTIPRWRWTSGQPATLTKVVDIGGQVKLQPYSSWSDQKIGDCQALQYVQSMEVDPNTGLMYVIDTGRVGIRGPEVPTTECPAKIVVFDLETGSKVRSHELPESVVSRDNFMNDIVLHYVGGSVRYAYISDVIEGRLHVFDFLTLTAHNVEDPSMKPEPGDGTVVHINGADYSFNAAVDGIAISADFRFVYYCPLGGYNLYQLPTSSLALAGSRGNVSPRLVGRKVSQSDGLAYGSKRLYFGAMGQNAVYYWDPDKDMRSQGLPIDRVNMRTQSELVRDDDRMQWPDTFAWDDQGWLWFVSNRLHLFNTNSLDFTGQNGSNMRVWKVYVNETSYLFHADARTMESVVG